MSYPDLTASTLTGTATVPTPSTVTRRVSTAYGAGVMTAQSNGLASATDVPYPMVQNANFLAVSGPTNFISAAVRSTQQTPPSIAPAAGQSTPYFSPYNWHTVGGSSVADSLGAYVKGTFTGTSLTVNVDTSAAFGIVLVADFPWLAVSIDGAPYVRRLVPATSPATIAVVIASGYPDTTHTFEIIYESRSTLNDIWPSPIAALRLPTTGAFTVDAGRVVGGPTSLQPRTMLFYGASADEVFPGADPTTDAPEGRAEAGWNRVVANLFSAEYGVVAYAGQGYLQGGAWGVPNMASSYDLHNSGFSRLSGGLLSPAPDIIVTTQGTNDVAPSNPTLAAAVAAQIVTLRAAAPSAWLLMSADVFGGRQVAIAAGVAAYQAAHPSDTKVRYVAFNDREEGVIANPAMMTLGHPNTLGQQTLGPIMASNFSRAIGWTSLTWKVKALNPTDGSYPQFFEVGDDGGIGFFHVDGTLADWTLIPFRVADNVLFLPGWTNAAPNTALGWLLSAQYAIQELKQHLGASYPTVTPAPDYFPASFPAPHIDGSGNLVATVQPDPDAGATAELRTYTLWDLIHSVAIGPPTYVNVPNRRVVAIGTQQANVRMDILTLTPFPIWSDTLAINADQSFSVSITPGTQAELTLVDNTTKAFLARASMTTQFPREFFFYAGDTEVLDSGLPAYGSDFEEVTFPPYASSVVGIALLTQLATGLLSVADTTIAQNNVRYIAMGLANIVQLGGPLPGGTPFGWLQRYGGTGASIAYYRTGTIAWAPMFMYEALIRLPASMWTGSYAAWKTTIETAAAAAMTWCHGQDDGTNLCRFGTGRTDPVTGLFDPTYQYTFHAQEHNSDLFFAELSAFAYTGTAAYHTKATARAAAMVSLLWDEANGRLDQSCDALGVKSGVASLDCYSWGGRALAASGHADKAIRAFSRVPSYLMTSTAGAGTPNPGASVQGYCGFTTTAADGIADPAPSVWCEGTFSILGVKQGLGLYATADQSLYAGMAGLQQFDGSYRNFQLDDSNPFGITNYRSCQAAAWSIIARYPQLVWWVRTL